MIQEFTVMRTSELRPGQTKVVTVADVELAIINVDGQYHALLNACPHIGGPLGEGELQGHSIVCPWHCWKFDVTNGHGQEHTKHADVYTVSSISIRLGVDL